MTTQPNRLASGGRIDRVRQVAFTFDGKSYSGYAGDTLASALLANGVKLSAAASSIIARAASFRLASRSRRAS